MNYSKKLISFMLYVFLGFTIQTNSVFASGFQQLPRGNNPANTPLQLNDIHLPEQVSQLPTAYGWWLLLLLVVLSCYVAVRKYILHKRKNRQKTKALSTLSKSMTSEEVMTLLKWVAMQYFPRTQLSKLYGEQLQQFLVKQLPEKYQQQFSSLSSDNFNSHYQKNPSIKSNEQCFQAAKLWIEHALPPKNTSSIGGVK